MPHNQPNRNAREAFDDCAITISSGTNPIHASGHKSKSGNERIVSSAELVTTETSASAGACAPMDISIGGLGLNASPAATSCMAGVYQKKLQAFSFPFNRPRISARIEFWKVSRER